MNERTHVLLRTFLSTATLSNTALIWWAPLAIASTLAAMPYRIPPTDAAAWGIAIGAQVLFSGIVIIGRSAIRRQKARGAPSAVALVVVGAGAVRGIVLVLASALLTGRDATAVDVVLRAVNSAVIALVGLAVLGAIIQFGRDYRRDYSMLRGRALLLQREDVAPTLSDATIAGWVGVQRSLRTTADSAREHLGPSDVSADALRAVAQVIGDALAQEVRPISHGLWVGSSDAPPRLRATAVARAALRPWRVPMIAIVVFGVLVGLGAINRAGVVDGVIFALYTTLTMGVVVVVSTALGARLPHSKAIGVFTVLLTPVLVVTASLLIGQGVLHADEDWIGAAMTGVTASMVIAGAAFVRRVGIERDVLLDELQAWIDAQGVDVLTRRTETDEWGSSLGAFVHHSVQSELTALRMQLMEAADADDATHRTSTRTDALARFDRLVSLQPPWVQRRDGRTVVQEVASAWSGIADVHLSLIDAGTQDQWQVAGQVVEEAVANAVRAGGARTIRVEVVEEHGALLVDIADDGRGLGNPHGQGIGTWWLDRVAPQDWERHSSPSGTRLHVRIQ